ncbi:hypothetical protein NLI96_g3896 [Meripilus lineatus]|uniref:DNA polymerase epsilon subunit D n=1 Tax=Meripilus lineatus TaxID=2056292 RepID=A0AAD5YG58_9APHY|nr:hypothetical protein NLI96_g3896 [Physisporinus lineatus]
MPRKEPAAGQSSAQAQQEAISEGIDSFELPRSLVTRIARSAFPDNVKLQKETVTALLKGSTVFVNYLAATAHDVAASKQHKSVSASDVLKALELTQFGDLVDKLQGELQIYRDLQKTDKGKKGGSKAKAKDSEGATNASSKSKGKGKEKETEVQTSDSRARVPKESRPEQEQTEDADEEEEQAIEGEEDDMIEGEDDGVEEEDVDEVDEVEGEEGDEDDDQMVVEDDGLGANAGGPNVRDEDMED